jgi:hypothetical protein
VHGRVKTIHVFHVVMILVLKGCVNGNNQYTTLKWHFHHKHDYQHGGSGLNSAKPPLRGHRTNSCEYLAYFNVCHVPIICYNKQIKSHGITPFDEKLGRRCGANKIGFRLKLCEERSKYFHFCMGPHIYIEGRCKHEKPTRNSKVVPASQT